jgi:hypothetical protein
MEYKTIGGLLLLIIATASGIVYVNEATGYKSCPTGWALQENGQFVCESRDLDPQWCYKFSSPNAEGISTRCYLGVPVVEESKKTEVKPTTLTGDYTSSPDGIICYIKGNLRWKVPCNEI